MKNQQDRVNNKIYVTRPSMTTMDEYINEIRSLWDSHYLTNMGPKHEEFQSKLKDYLDVDHMELVVNGHLALELAINAMEFPEGGEVITTPFTFVSTTHAIVRNRLVPVYCDIREDNGCIDENKIEELISDRTCAILPVHVYGNICNIEIIDRIARKYNLKVIYDAAHAFGEEYDGKGIGSYGDASCFSFHATKVFNSIEGGAVCYRDEKIGEKIRGLKNFGIRNEEVIDCVGMNAKMNEFCAAMGICNLRHIDDEIDKRRNIYEAYQKNLASVDVKTMNQIQSKMKPNYSYFPILIDSEAYGISRDELHGILNKEGIITRKYFFPLINSLDFFKFRSDISKTPVAKKVAEQVLTLPMYADLSLEDVEKICDIIKQ